MRVWEDFENHNWLARSANANPNTIGGGIARGFRDLSQSVHEWGRSQFASSYARGGWARTAFAPTSGEALASGFRRLKPHAEGSAEHIANLKRLQKLDPESKSIAKALKGAQSAKHGILKQMGGRVLGGTLGAAFAISPMFTTPGGLDTKLRATAANTAGTALFGIGASTGATIGAAAFGAVSGGLLAPVGFVLGGIAGGFAADELGRSVVNAGFAFSDKLVASERKKRHLNWINDSSAFQTRKAHTMRQQSLSAMNRGMMASRSVLGREASFMHM